MYLTRLILNPQNRRVQKEIAAPYEMHRTILSAFPPRMAEDERVLWRLEVQPRTGLPVLLVQSQELPDWFCVSATKAPNFLMQTNQPNPAIKAYDPQITKGRQLSFRLRANPTVKREGKRLGLYREEEQITWLQRKAFQHGFRLLDFRISTQEIVTSTIHRGEETHTLKLFGIQYDGMLVVEEAMQFREALEHGIGSGKGMGFGLLSVASPGR